MPPALKQPHNNTLDSVVERIQQYPGQEQVDLAVEVDVPGSWFGGTAAGSLTTSERREKYTTRPRGGPVPSGKRVRGSGRRQEEDERGGGPLHLHRRREGRG